MSATVYYIPQTLRNWPWKLVGPNPYDQEADAEVTSWIRDFERISATRLPPAVARVATSLASWAYPYATLYDLRSCGDMMLVFNMIDDYIDRLDAKVAKSVCDMIMDAMENLDKPLPEGESSIVPEFARQFWQRASLNAPKAARERFLKAYHQYLDAVVQEAQHRSTSFNCTTDEYMSIRRGSIGSGPAFALMEISLGLDLPHEVMEHPAIVSLIRDASDIIILTNVNATPFIAILRGAVQWISDRNDEAVERFLAIRDDVHNHGNGVPSWGKDIDLQLEKYINGMGKWSYYLVRHSFTAPLKLIGFVRMTNGASVAGDTLGRKALKFNDLAPSSSRSTYIPPPSLHTYATYVMLIFEHTPEILMILLFYPVEA
ncbi:Terpene cyclase [Mycena sanguinolenta]|uniref:Terpene synthase n=1 Tax=Mycena sanguinolenta TaxID=230812 RepID=A0A8H6ZAY0_9AGAR|nr:Terpene cyclase [Mycena sanguinolenta]